VNSGPVGIFAQGSSGKKIPIVTEDFEKSEGWRFTGYLVFPLAFTKVAVQVSSAV